MLYYYTIILTPGSFTILNEIQEVKCLSLTTFNSTVRSFFKVNQQNISKSDMFRGDKLSSWLDHTQ